MMYEIEKAVHLTRSSQNLCVGIPNGAIESISLSSSVKRNVCYLAVLIYKVRNTVYFPRN